MRNSLASRIVVAAALAALVGSTSPSASAAIIAQFVQNTITPAAIAADPALANMQSWSLMVTNTDGHWASAGARLTLPAGSVYYQTPPVRGGGNTHPNPGAYAVFPDLEFDTYVSSARNQTGQNPPAILGPYPENDPPQSFGGATDPVPGRFSVSWGDPQATSGPGPGTYEILRITFPRSVNTPVGFVLMSQVAPDQTIGFEVPWPEPAATGLFFVVLAAATARPRHHSHARLRPPVRSAITMRPRLPFNSCVLALCFAVAAIAPAHPGSGIALDRAGQVYFTDTGCAICMVDTKGKLTEFRGSRFHWLDIDADGRFAGSERSFGEWFERVTEKGAKPCVVQCSDFPFTFARDGNLYYADTRQGRGRIVRRTPEGRETVLARDPALESIDGITCGPDGALYVTQNIGDNEVALRKVTLDGAISTLASNFAGREPVNDPPADTPAAYCRGLAVDADGVMYVAATGSRRVLRITPQGQVSTILESPAPWQPTGVAVHDGAVYVLEWREPPAAQLEDRPAWLPRIRKIDGDGAVSTVVTVER